MKKTRGLRKREAACVEAVSIPLELDETRTTSTESDFPSFHPINEKATDNSFD